MDLEIVYLRLLIMELGSFNLDFFCEVISLVVTSTTWLIAIQLPVDFVKFSAGIMHLLWCWEGWPPPFFMHPLQKQFDISALCDGYYTCTDAGLHKSSKIWLVCLYPDFEKLESELDFFLIWKVRVGVVGPTLTMLQFGSNFLARTLILSSNFDIINIL